MSNLVAVSDLHVTYQENREVVEQLRAASPQDWLLVAGDVGERLTDVAWVLSLLKERFARVVWAPGNHELWTMPDDPVTLRGVERYEALVELCRRLDVLTPEDPYETWHGPDGPVTIAPLFLGYDYTWLPAGHDTKESGLAYAHQTGVVCTDEYMLHPDPYPTREDWCRARVAETERRLKECDPAVPLVLVNHYPLVRQPTMVLRFPEFAQWCGTELTADWHTRFNTAAMVYGHLHIPRSTVYDGVPFEEVSLGYPREWRPRTRPHGLPRRILPVSPP
ncbi:metallophosphoesterase family protein [Actinophytocola algeriensis]|uniref:3',5'-cyclic AMP phosphodiesterase CpdA n=1 Tax=Actinophytocola algeriensis TaxID=1768010 RepID=A0A7W7Q9Q7_9PSEU|nr:metallophosphoesterase [Actinophytocola algeriensis]MBB4909274.1 3',5'-cyclic AMP phosphodiesterase CpdA [Actinophytocola algeriensis]MBE1474338.1 3',5'-cyclic AMP phosphodiesterase CpdA [Actinophytocola algeriensis]